MARRTAEEVRLELLAVEPQRPIEQDCGIKDYYFHHPEDCPAAQYRPPACRHHLREEQNGSGDLPGDPSGSDNGPEPEFASAF